MVCNFSVGFPPHASGGLRGCARHRGFGEAHVGASKGNITPQRTKAGLLSCSLAGAVGHRLAELSPPVERLRRSDGSYLII